MEKEPIKSPFMEGQSTVVENHTSSIELIEKGIEFFARFVQTVRDHPERELTDDFIVGFLAGFPSGLEAIGLPQKESIQIGRKMSEIIQEIEKNGCGNCDNCKKHNNEKNG